MDSMRELLLEQGEGLDRGGASLKVVEPLEGGRVPIAPRERRIGNGLVIPAALQGLASGTQPPELEGEPVDLRYVGVVKVDEAGS